MLAKMQKKNLAWGLLLSLIVIPALTYSFCRAVRSFNKHCKEKRRFFSSEGWLDANVRYPVVENKAIVVVVSAYNNEAVSQRNLQSIFDQTYENYRVIYIDNSLDTSASERAKIYSQEQDKEKKINFIHNPGREKKLENVYKACHSCLDGEIVVFLEGNDWLANEKVLERINQAYQNPIVWMTYGSAITYPDYGRRSGQPIKNYKSIRESHNAALSALHTCYAGLFKQISLEDFLYQGVPFPEVQNTAYMVPMLEMGYKHALFIPEVLYVINDPLHRHFITEGASKKIRSYIKKRPNYQILPETFDPCHTTKMGSKDEQFELIVISKNNPLFLADSLEEYRKKLVPLPHITVFFQASNKDYVEAYKHVMKNFPQITFLQDEAMIGLYLEDIKKKTYPYIGVVTDNFSFREKMLLESFLSALKITANTGFVFSDSFDKTSSIVDTNTTFIIEQLLNFNSPEEGEVFACIRKEFLSSYKK